MKAYRYSSDYAIFYLFIHIVSLFYKKKKNDLHTRDLYLFFSRLENVIWLLRTTRQVSLIARWCILQFNNAIYHCLYLSMKISFNRGKSHLILFSSRCSRFAVEKHDLKSLFGSSRVDGIWLVIAFLFHSFFRLQKDRFILYKFAQARKNISSRNLLPFIASFFFHKYL